MNKYKNNNYIYCVMLFGIIILSFTTIKELIAISEIRNTNYEFCYQGTCYYQKIGDYLDGNN